MTYSSLFLLLVDRTAVTYIDSRTPVYWPPCFTSLFLTNRPHFFFFNNHQLAQSLSILQPHRFSPFFLSFTTKFSHVGCCGFMKKMSDFKIAVLIKFHKSVFTRKLPEKCWQLCDLLLKRQVSQNDTCDFCVSDWHMSVTWKEWI